MTLQALPSPLALATLPYVRGPASQWASLLTTGTSGTLDAASEKFAFVGNILICDGSASKTLSSAGGKIHFVAGASTTFANGTTNLDIGVQDTDQAAVFMQPDGTFDTKDTLVGGTDTITSSAINTVTLSTGSKTVTDGMKLAVVFDMTARGGADSVKISASLAGTAAFVPAPATMTNLTGSWTNATDSIPNVLLEFDDGTFGIFYGGQWVPAADSTSGSITTASAPDEWGTRFQLPFKCELHGVEFPARTTAGAKSGTTGIIRLLTGSALSASLVTSENIDGFDVRASGLMGYRLVKRFTTPQTLEADTTYYLTFEASDTQTWQILYLTWPAAGQLAWLPLGTNAYKVTRDTGAGAFTEATAELVPITLIISKLDDGIYGRANYALGV
jgi:hypothetical protein